MHVLCLNMLHLTQTVAKMVSYAKRSIPAVNDSPLEALLSNSTKYTTRRLESLRSTVTKVIGANVTFATAAVAY